MPSILFVFTSAANTLTGEPTGWYLPEAAHPYYVLAPHAKIDFAAPKGPNPPLDQASVDAYKGDEECIKFLADETVKEKLTNAKLLTDVKVSDYDAIFYPGGWGPVLDLAFDPINAKLASDFWTAGKLVASVCHGPAALVDAVDADGKSIFAGRNFTGFSDAEEEYLGTTKRAPFLLEDKIISLGGLFTKADKVFGSHVVVDGRLITGQNPSSATDTGKAILKALE
ncbi:ThiJ/PfpI [Ephemerocybe angulata]|uniref:D-lactate dehydratase n=1 Tax=Ephemerocybe angulata TaxID=980116 RepID=A0A8H6IHR4_9AGAR|nr:ThiJ/PfpI [Tulosesus angulatus]